MSIPQELSDASDSIEDAIDSFESAESDLKEIAQDVLNDDVDNYDESTEHQAFNMLKTLQSRIEQFEDKIARVSVYFRSDKNPEGNINIGNIT